MDAGTFGGLDRLAQVRMSFSTARARPQMIGPLTSRAMVSTDSKSPGEEMGKAGFDDIHLQSGELPRDADLLLNRQACRQGLFTVAQGGVEDDNSFFMIASVGAFRFARPSIRPSARPRERHFARRMRATKAGRR